MPRVVNHPHGVIVDGKLYRRDEWMAAERQTLKDWALWLMIMVGLAASVALAIAFLVGLLWLVIEALRGLRGAIG